MISGSPQRLSSRARPLVAVAEVLALAVAVVGAFAAVGSLSGPAAAADKVWVCKYVGTPGQNERLKEGQNPVDVSISAAGPVGTLFDDAQGRSYVIAVVVPGESPPSCPATPIGPEPSPTCTTTPSTPTEVPSTEEPASPTT